MKVANLLTIWVCFFGDLETERFEPLSGTLTGSPRTHLRKRRDACSLA